MWIKANPNLGRTVSYDTYQQDVERAEQAPAAMRIKYDEFMAVGSLAVLGGTVPDMMQVYKDLDDHIVRCG